MSQLYTVQLTRQEIVCQYDPITGFRKGEVKRDIPQTYGDLPLALAQRYKTMFPDNNVVITAQTELGGYVPRELAKDPTWSRSARYNAPPVTTTTPKVDARLAAATSGSLGEAL